jgi:hypothetical protein
MCDEFFKSKSFFGLGADEKPFSTFNQGRRLVASANTAPAADSPAAWSLHVLLVWHSAQIGA